MWGNVWRAAMVGAVLAGAVAGPALADDGDYLPDTPREPGLDGSSVAAVCVDLAPRIQYSIVYVDADASSLTGPVTVRTAAFAAAPDVTAAGVDTAHLVLTDGTSILNIPLPLDASGNGEGSVLWPGVEVAADGAVTALPGWRLAGSSWEPRDDAAAWTTGDIRAQLRVGDRSLDVPLAYPPFSDECMTPFGVASSGATPGGGLAATGGQLPIAVGLAGAASLLVGGVLIIRRRRRALS